MSNRELNIILRLKNEMSKELQNMKSEFDNFSQTAEEVGFNFTKAGAALTGVGAGLGGLLVKTGLTAARTETLGVALEAVAKSTGTSMDVLREQEKALKAQGITTQEARKTLTRFMQSQLDVADATKVARVAQDLAVIAGENSSQTTERLTNAIANQNPMLLRQVGIVANLNDIFNDHALVLGKEVSELTSVEKKQALLNLIFEEGEKVAGTYEAAMGTAGKQLGSLSRHIETASENFGEAFLPTMLLVIEATTDLLKWFNGLSKETQTLITRTVMITSAVTLALGGFLLFVVAVKAFIGVLLVLKPILIATGALIAGLSSPILIIIGLLGVIGSTIAFLALNWKEHWDTIKWVMAANRDFIIEAWRTVAKMFKDVWESIVGIFDWAHEKIMAVLNPIIKTAQKAIDLAKRAKEAAGGVVSGAKQRVSSLIDRVTPFADGGIVTRPTMGLVGEAGPEAIIPLNRRGLSLGNINITISNNSFMGEDDMAEKVGDKIINIIKQSTKI